MDLDELQKLHDLKEKGILTEEEFQAEKARILANRAHTPPPPIPISPAPPQAAGIDTATYCTLLHLSALLLGIGPLIFWLIKKDENAEVDYHGKSALNFVITMSICFLSTWMMVWIMVGFHVWTFIPAIMILVLFLRWALALTALIFIIIAAVEASSGRRYKYPIAYPFITLP